MAVLGEKPMAIDIYRKSCRGRVVTVIGTGAFLGERSVGRPFWTMGFEPVLFGGRPCDLPRLCSSTYPSVSFARCFSRSFNVRRDGREGDR